MGFREESDCVGCETCVGTCAYRYSERYVLVCDKCGCDVDKLYRVNNDELCRECAVEESKDELIEYAEEESGEEVDPDFIDEDIVTEFLENMYEVVND